MKIKLLIIEIVVLIEEDKKVRASTNVDALLLCYMT